MIFKKGGEMITFFIAQMTDLGIIKRLFGPKSTCENHILTPASYMK